MFVGTQQNVKNRLTLDRLSCSVAKQDLRRLCDILQERASTAAENEMANFAKGQQTDEQYENNKRLLREALIIHITITSTSGQELFGTVEDVFESPNFPDEVQSLYVNSETALRALYNYFPRNSFEIFLDFTRPGVFDFTLLPSQQTPNESSLKVQGYEATWANGLFHELQSFLDSRKASLTFAHRHSVYDIFLFSLGFPLGFWVCFKLAPFMSSTALRSSPFLGASLYVYVFMITLFLFRGLFHYFRWVFPIVEYKHERNRAIAHRAVLGVLSIGLIGTVIYELLKAFVL